jgi:single-stranded-DNA-specific exonuclease
MKWQIAEPISEDFKNKFPEIDPIVLQLLWNRGIRTQEQIDEFLYPDYGQDLHDPFLFSQMKKAVERIFKAVEQKEKIMVHGDYDTDGVCSALIMVSTLQALGADVDVYLPHRELEGYGLNLRTIEKFSEWGVNLIVTTDCGISNKKEIEKATKLGMDVVVTDHHAAPKELPKCDAIVNPNVPSEKYPFKELSGAGVAFKLVQAVLKKIKNQESKIKDLDAEAFEKWLLDLVAIATVTDIMSIIGENRTLVKYGLVVLNKTRRIGLKKLIDKVELKGELDTFDIGFRIGPRLNAAGRINHANQAYKLLTSSDPREAEQLAEELDKTNTARQTLTDKIVEEVKKQIGEVKNQKILFALGKDWPLGILGLAAGKIADNFWRPTFVMTERDGKIDGSGRSIPEFDMIDALWQSPELFSHFGGHRGACGFTLKNKNKLEDFKKKMIKIAEQKLSGLELAPVLLIDADVDLEKINWELFELLEKFSPFGKGNERPRYLVRKVDVENLETVGQNGNHLRLMLSHKNGAVKKFIGFCFGDWCQKIKVGDKIDVVFEVDVNEWNGNRELQLKIVDLKLSSI